MEPKVIDFTCKGCGKTMRPEPHPGVTVIKLPSGGLMYTQNDEPYIFACPWCGKSFSVWKPGPETASGAGGFSGAIAQGDHALAVGAGGVVIGGSFSGDIVVGHGNTVVNGRRYG